MRSWKSLSQKLGPSGRINWCKVDLIASGSSLYITLLITQLLTKNIHPLAQNIDLELLHYTFRAIYKPFCCRLAHSTGLQLRKYLQFKGKHPQPRRDGWMLGKRNPVSLQRECQTEWPGAPRQVTDISDISLLIGDRARLAAMGCGPGVSGNTLAEVRNSTGRRLSFFF